MPISLADQYLENDPSIVPIALADQHFKNDQSSINIRIN
jgi:hypothetical protein